MSRRPTYPYTAIALALFVGLWATACGQCGKPAAAPPGPAPEYEVPPDPPPFPPTPEAGAPPPPPSPATTPPNPS